MIFFRPVCRAKIICRSFSSWVVGLTNACSRMLVVLRNRKYTYRSHERKLILRYRPLSKVHSMDNLLTLFNMMWDIRYFILNNSNSVSVIGFPLKRLSFRARIIINSWWSLKSIIFVKVQQHVERHTKVEVSLRQAWSDVPVTHPAF